jgi:hypothetical protein
MIAGWGPEFQCPISCEIVERTGAQMDNTSDADSRVAAFMAAALALLVLPLIVVFGVIALGLTTYAGVTSGFGDVFSGKASWPVWALFLCWVLASVFGVLAIALRFNRRSA